MSLQANWNREIPEDIAAVGQELLEEFSPYRLVGDEVNDFLTLDDFSALYSAIGRGAICPMLLSLITVFQYLENLPDREAALQAVMRLDWKYALHLPLTWRGFNYSSLHYFRERLLEHQAERLIFDKILEWLRALGFLKKHGRQRSDSTHIIGNVEHLSRLELAWETLRKALEALQLAAPQWYSQVITAAFHETYVVRRSDWQLSQAEVAAQLQAAGQDGFWLLEQWAASAPEAVRQLPEMQLLRQVWAQQFEWEPDSRKVRVRQPPIKGTDVIATPHDPEARWSKKRSTEWDGYRLQITETAEELEEAETPVAETASAECADQPAETAAAIEPREAAETVPSTCPRGKKKSQRKERIQFITDIDVVPANADDSQATLDIEKRLLAQDLKPQEHIVDKGYVSGANLAHSAQLGIELVGPAPADHSRKPAGYKQRDFQLDFEQQTALCPQGQTSEKWYRRLAADGRVGADVRFGAQCAACPVQAQCAGGQNGRTLSISPYYRELQQRRAEQQTMVFKEKYKRRAAVEGTIAEVTRKHGLRRARYRGQQKVRLQALFTGAAVNLKRLGGALPAQKATALGVAVSG